MFRQLRGSQTTTEKVNHLPDFETSAVTDDRRWNNLLVVFNLHSVYGTAYAVQHLVDLLLRQPGVREKVADEQLRLECREYRSRHDSRMLAFACNWPRLINL